MYGSDCDAAIAKAAAAVVHVQSQSHRRLILAMKDWACCVLICHEQKRTFGGWRTSSKDFASSLHGKLQNTLRAILNTNDNFEIRNL